MGSALLDTTPGSSPDSATAQAQAALRTNAGEALRQQAAERLAAHRSRRAGTKPAHDSVQQTASATNARAAQIAAAVAERYAKSQSYRAFLASEAERAVQQARAAAEVASIQAEAMEAAQQSLLHALESEAAEPSGIIAEQIRTPEARVDSSRAAEELSFWPEREMPAKPVRQAGPQPASRPASRPAVSRQPAAEGQPAHPASAAHAASAPPFAVRVEQEFLLRALERDALHENRFFAREDAEALALDEEIAFRQAPVFEEFVSRPEPLPANLIEFPRQLVASRKARPRLAEGPLREETADADDNQLRIFEVDTAQISTEPVTEEARAAQWTSIFLDAPQRAPVDVAEPSVATTSSTLPGTASVARRGAAAAINGCIVGAALTAFAAAAMITSGNFETLRTLTLGGAAHILLNVRAGGASMLAAGAVVALFLVVVFQALFFTFSTATPGMRCVRIGLCTFKDENPTRKAMRRRIVAVLLSAVPFGLGFIWAALDEEKLSWHDRVSGTYQRVY